MHVICYIIGIHLLVVANGLGITVPGTKWCGPGNTAANYDDLGSEMELDICCRAHDNCPHAPIESKEERHGIRNEHYFPLFSCSCETSFRNCLMGLRNFESAALGRIYFSTTSECYDYGHPIVACKEHQWDTFLKRCINYTVDDSRPKQWQLYDLAFYTHPTSSSSSSEEAATDNIEDFMNLFA